MSASPCRPTDDLEKIGARRAPDQPPGLPPRGEGGFFDIRIARDGTWFYRGTPINRKPLVKLFSTVIRRDEAGDFWLVTPVERGRIVVEDAPFTAVELSREGDGQGQVLRLRTNVDDWVEVGPGHPVRVATDPDSAAPRPYILVRDRLEALVVRSVFYELVDLAVESEHDGASRLGLWSNAIFFPLGDPP